MAKGVYPRTERHRSIARRASAAAALGRKGKTYDELYGAYRAGAIRSALAESKRGDKNPAKREEVRKKIGSAAKGRPSWLSGLSKEADPRVMAMSDNMRGRRVGAAAFISAESKARRNAKTRATWAARPELKARVFNAENNEKRRVAHIKALRDGKYATKRDTNIERAIEQKLKNDGLVLNTDYFKQVALPAGAPQFVVDFYVPEQRLVIEGYGCFWHKCTKCGYTGPRNVDEKRREVLAGEGLSLKIVWGHEI